MKKYFLLSLVLIPFSPLLAHLSVVSHSKLLNSTHPNALITIKNTHQQPIHNVYVTLKGVNRLDQNNHLCQTLLPNKTCHITVKNAYLYQGKRHYRIHADNERTVNVPIFSIGRWTFDADVITTHLDESNKALYMGGAFRQVGQQVTNAAMLEEDGTVKLNSPLVDGQVFAMAKDNQGGQYIGGKFTAINGINIQNLAHINSDGSLDQNFKPNPDNKVSALYFDGDVLFVGGDFNTIENLVHPHFAKINTSTQEVDLNFNAGFDGTVYSITKYCDKVYVSGAHAISAPENKTVVALDAISGKKVDGFNFEKRLTAKKIMYFNDQLYVLARYELFKIDPTTGHIDASFKVANGKGHQSFYDMTHDDTSIYLGGSFTQVNGLVHNNLIRVFEDGQIDESFQLGTNGIVLSLAKQNDFLYLGGRFTKIMNQPVKYMARINLGLNALDAEYQPNFNSIVELVRTTRDGIFAAGTFHLANAQSHPYLVKFDLSSGNLDLEFKPNISYRVWSIISDSDGLYIGGDFTKVDDTPFTQAVARLFPDTGRVDLSFRPRVQYGSVFSMAKVENDLYIAGSFKAIAGKNRYQYLSKVNAIDGKVDSDFPTRFNSVVNSIVIKNDYIYAGGWFRKAAGKESMAYLAKINRFTTEPDENFNPYVQGSVNKLMLLDNALLIGGNFKGVGQAANASLFSGLAKINLSSGAPVKTFTPNVRGGISDMVMGDSYLYIGGNWLNRGGTTRSAIHLLRLNPETGMVDLSFTERPPCCIKHLRYDNGVLQYGGSFKATTSRPAKFAEVDVE